MKKVVKTDIVVIGGGIAGLWLLHRLRQVGYSAILLESHALGGGQTNKAQGIIHGGLKYALHGSETAASQAIFDMPKSWAESLEGRGPVDLSSVPLLSNHQYLWSTGSIASKIAAFFASKTLKGQVRELAPDAFPSLFQNAQFKGQVYSLNEIVIDVPSVVKALVKFNQDAIFKIDPVLEQQIKFGEKGDIQSFEIQSDPIEAIEIKAKRYVFTAGSGNQNLLKPLKKDGIDMQRRPLHMVLVKTHLPYELFAHCIGLGMTPRLTITTHKASDGEWVWYIGGQIAEEGVKRESQLQIETARQELKTLFPWLDFSRAEFATFFVDRAEPLQPDGGRPDVCYAEKVENVIAAWPVKLAFAPRLAQNIIQQLSEDNITASSPDLQALCAWPMPPLAKPVWDELL